MYTEAEVHDLIAKKQRDLTEELTLWAQNHNLPNHGYQICFSMEAVKQPVVVMMEKMATSVDMGILLFDFLTEDRFKRLEVGRYYYRCINAILVVIEKGVLSAWESRNIKPENPSLVTLKQFIENYRASDLLSQSNFGRMSLNALNHVLHDAGFPRVI